jgi:hypothetical protein
MRTKRDLSRLEDLWYVRFMISLSSKDSSLLLSKGDTALFQVEREKLMACYPLKKAKGQTRNVSPGSQLVNKLDSAAKF